MITILCDQPTPRHLFTFNVIFRRWLRTSYRIITDQGDIAEGGLLIRYQTNGQANSFCIPNAGLLGEKSIRPIVPEVGQWQGKPVFFPMQDVHASLPFDLFSAVFYMISRYEEYLPFTPDEHGRFEAPMSHAGLRGFHHIPVVDFWLSWLRQAIEDRCGGLLPKADPFNFQPTYDIDQFFSYRYKGLFRNGAGVMRDLAKGNLPKVGLRMQVLFGNKKDPFDSFSYLDELHLTYGLKPIYFIHPGTYGKFDKNIPLQKAIVARRVRELAEKYTVGVHPSYISAGKPTLLRAEMDALAAIIGSPADRCRQHFLRIRIPDSFRLFMACGIRHDYSLGWASDNGFRAGTGRSFPFYDLEKEEETPLILHPLCMMDGAFRNYLHMHPEEAKAQISEIIRSLKDTNSVCTTLWHNESLGTSRHWAGWRSVYEHTLREAL